MKAAEGHKYPCTKFMFTNPMSDKIRHFTTFNYEAITQTYS